MIKNIKVQAKDEETRIDRWLKRNFSSLNQNFIEKNLRKGLIKINRSKVKANYIVIKDDIVNIFNYSKENVKLLLNEDATQINIKNKLYQIAMEAGKNDRLLVFYGGHGETFPLPSDGELGYLLPVDGKRENLYTSSLSMQEFKHISEFKHF